MAAHPIMQRESRSRNPSLCDLFGGAPWAVKKCRKGYRIYRYRYSNTLWESKGSWSSRLFSSWSLFRCDGAILAGIL